ncbi:hypothetical protein Mp_7g10470 [Marchantia polymorpha subsp. ruderalis]|uniref:Uncharacterized protein n=2 Tax=Marchantia polymorpha TaxID=3197 RepID=A0AAF6BY39_MARPO|nr:hypothetical protein MARPO_0003s0066 [Marchantia polymorpha]BBN16923.1 hypothetical protein Mp_7g10470 [Marchantia polymorpha subsp. ruderalis]|eukprot:PTQ49164.1 hypothetical protein MARPO_0003s0066 [Marchantia polymorpha]
MRPPLGCFNPLPSTPLYQISTSSLPSRPSFLSSIIYDLHEPCQSFSDHLFSPSRSLTILLTPSLSFSQLDHSSSSKIPSSLALSCLDIHARGEVSATWSPPTLLYVLLSILASILPHLPSQIDAGIEKAVRRHDMPSSLLHEHFRNSERILLLASGPFHSIPFHSIPSKKGLISPGFLFPAWHTSMPCGLMTLHAETVQLTQIPEHCRIVSVAHAVSSRSHKPRH